MLRLDPSSAVGIDGGIHTAGLTWDASLTGLTLKQADLTTNSGTGATTTIQAQNETGTTSVGGALVLTSGTGTSTHGALNLQIGGVTQIGIAATGVVSFTNKINANNDIHANVGGVDITNFRHLFQLTGQVSFDIANATPKIYQIDQTAGSTNGVALTIQAQNATGTTSTGGNLVLSSGTGTTAAGTLTLQSGGTPRFAVGPGGISFFNVALAGRQTYTTSNHVDSRTLNESAPTTTALANVVGTMIKDLQAFGLMA